MELNRSVSSGNRSETFKLLRIYSRTRQKILTILFMIVLVGVSAVDTNLIAQEDITRVILSESSVDCSGTLEFVEAQTPQEGEPSEVIIKTDSGYKNATGTIYNGLLTNDTVFVQRQTTPTPFTIVIDCSTINTENDTSPNTPNF